MLLMVARETTKASISSTLTMENLTNGLHMIILRGVLPFKPVVNSPIDRRAEQIDNCALIEQAYPSSMSSY